MGLLGRFRRGAAALVFGLTALCFLGAARDGFVWDDFTFLHKTYGYRVLDLAHLRWMFTALRFSNYCPLVWLSYGLDYAAWGLRPAPFHLTNVFLHALNAVLFFYLARRVLALARGEDAASASVTGAAVVSALVFALHPLRVESVAWISERRDVLSGLFFLSTLLLYLRARAPGAPAPRRDLALSWCAYVLACLSKASVVPLPAVLLVLDVCLLERPGRGAPRRALAAMLAEKALFAVPAAAAAWLAVRAARLASPAAGVVLGPADAAGRAIYGLGFYLVKTVLPLGLSPYYPAPRDFPAAGASVALMAAALAAAAALLAASGLSRRQQAGLWAYYAAMLAPVLGIVGDGTQLVAARYSYLSCLGWALLPGALLARALSAPPSSRARARLAALTAAGGLALAAFAFQTQRQLGAWSDSVTLWRSAAERFPDAFLPQLNLAAGLLEEGRPAEAEPFARRAAALQPFSVLAPWALARSLDDQGRGAEALKVLEARLSRGDAGDAPPDQLGEAYAYYGTLLLRAGRRRDALAALELGARLAPGSPAAQGQLGSLLARSGRKSEALAHLRAAVLLAPDDESLRAAYRAARGPSKLSP